MASNSSNFSFFSTSRSTNNCGSVFAGIDELDNNHGANDHGNDCDRTLRGQSRNLVRAQRRPECRDQQHKHDVFNPHSGRRFSAGDHDSRSRDHRNRGHLAHNRNSFYYYVLIGLLQVISFASPVRAQTSDGTTIIANPQSSSTGSVTNSAVQINQGSYSTQGFSSGHYCNSGTIVFTPFYLGGDFFPEYTRSQNFGAQISFSVPLDGSITEICKELGLKKIQKQRVDMLLTRVRECTNMYDKGYMIRPESPYSAICDDVVPIAAYSKSVGSSQVSSEPD
mgnify:FL=1